VNREVHAPFCERPGVKSLRPTRHGEGPGVRLRKAGASGNAAFIPLEDLNAKNDE
jgi:hypothetical protein